MAIELGTAYVSISASAKGIGKSLQGELEGPLSKSGAKAGKATGEQFGQSLKSSGLKNVEGVGQEAGAKVAKGFGGSLKSGLSALPIDSAFLGGAAIAAGVKFAVNAASDLQESLSKTDAVFKGNAREVKAWADTASTSFGQSKQQALEAASTFGNLFQAFGVGLEPATEMSTTLTRLASDLASFNNTSTEEAIEALRSGLSGETEPLKRYGVALTDARLKQEALGLGLIKDVKQPLDAAAKSQAAYALIMKDTKLAQGDFERTSDGFANSMRTLQATIQEAAAEIGTSLLPGLSKLAQSASKAIGPIAKLVGALSELDTEAGLIGEVTGIKVDFQAESWDKFITQIDKVKASILQMPRGDFDLPALPVFDVEAIERGQIQLGFLGDRMRAASLATMQASLSADAYSRQMTNEADTVAAANTALQNHINLQLAAIDSTFAVTAADNAFVTAVEAANVATDDLNTGVNEQQVAYDQATQAAIATAGATVEYARSAAEAQGATLSAKDEQKLLIDTLMTLASRAGGPVAAAIGTVITKLQDVGAQKPNPTLGVNDQASSTLNSVRTSLGILAGTIVTPKVRLVDEVTGRIREIRNSLETLAGTRLVFGVPGGLASGVRNWRGGWTVVGEEGPELVNLPKGSDVFNATQTAAMGGISAVTPAAQAVVITGNTFIGSGPDITRLLSAKITEGRRAGVQFLGS